MKIETIDDWNALLAGCGCCEMPVCPVPDMECESISGESQMAFRIQELISPGVYKWWRRSRTEYNDGGYMQFDAPATHWTTLGGEAIEPYDIVYTEGDPKTGGISSEDLSVENTPTASRTDALAAMSGALDWSGMDKGASCSSSLFNATPSGWTPAWTVFVTYSRFRWVVPDTWKGPYFKITWDVVFFPYDEESEPTPVATDQTWTWEGPGDPENEDSWKSGFYEIPVPSEPGQSRVVNIRFECYKSAKLGNPPPQVTGEAYEIPA